MDLQLKEHVAIVTGGASGIGLAIARGFAAEGCHVALWDRAPQVTERAGDLAAEFAVRTIGLRVDVAGMPSAHSLDLGSMGEPMKAMRACTDELLDHWGLDAAAQRSLQRLPVPVTTPQRWFEATSYPDNAAGLNGYVHFRLTVDATGAVQDCAIPSATKGSVLAKATCETLKRRARFKPAIDQSGKPVSSYYADTVRWYFLD